MEERQESIGESVRCPECGGITDALWRDEEDLTCSFCRDEPGDPVDRDGDAAGRPTPGRKSIAELMMEAVERDAELMMEAVERDAAREARQPGAFFEGLRRAAERTAERKRRERTEGRDQG